MCCVRWSNEAATVHADITADHRDVPAFCNFLEWQGAKPRTPEIEMSILHGCRNLKFTSTILSMFGFPSIWWRFWSRWYFWRTSIIRILLRLICFPSDLHVKGLRYWWISSKIQFCLVWYPWWLRHGAMEPLEATPLWVTVDELDVGIDTFELVIRLSKVEQTALPFISLMSCPAIPAVLCEPLGWSSLCWMSIWTVRNFRFTAAAPAFKVQHDMNARTWMPGHECQAGTWPSGVVFFRFWWFLVRLNISCI